MAKSITNDGQTVNFDAAAQTYDGIFYIEQVDWNGATTGLTMVLSDENGEVIVQRVCPTETTAIDIITPLRGKAVKGLAMTTLGAGTVRIHLQRGK